jgi:hypothetical protein
MLCPARLRIRKLSIYLKTKSQGLSLVELIVTLFVASVLILMVGVLSDIAFTSHEDLRKENQVFKDIYDGFDLLTYSVRNAATVYVDLVNNALTLEDIRLLDGSLTNRTFKKDNADFKYIDSNGEHIIIQGVDSLNFDFRCNKDVDGNWVSNPPCDSNSRVFHITLSGQKDKEPFNLFTDVTKRN